MGLHAALSLLPLPLVSAVLQFNDSAPAELLELHPVPARDARRDGGAELQHGAGAEVYARARAPLSAVPVAEGGRSSSTEALEVLSSQFFTGAPPEAAPPTAGVP